VLLRHLTVVTLGKPQMHLRGVKFGTQEKTKSQERLKSSLGLRKQRVKNDSSQVLDSRENKESRIESKDDKKSGIRLKKLKEIKYDPRKSNKSSLDL
jgi:hypothetical protein